MLNYNVTTYDRVHRPVVAFRLRYVRTRRSINFPFCAEVRDTWWGMAKHVASLH